LLLDPTLVNLGWTFACGQAFRWRDVGDGWWAGVVSGCVIRVRTAGDRIVYASYPDLAEGFWPEYLRLDFDLARMYAELGASDPYARQAFERWAGLRILRQDPLETVSTFICTTANTIPRIIRAVDGMSCVWGRHIATIEGTPYHAFPSPEVFSDASIPALERDCNLGYRSRVLVRAMEVIGSLSEGWAASLRSAEYAEAHAELMRLPGVGPKVADCVCVFALDKDEAVPVDTHIRQIAIERYLPELAQRSLTANTYNRIAGTFRERFGERAGWVQQYLFYTHLMRHRDVPVL
ncbi:MAG: hypothetical protein M3506_03560, partial [Chloroflexota bacterium]|nr:hypothetical protein [Chloroflexota bacterium]